MYKRFLLPLILLIGASLVLAAAASASTTLSIQATVHQNLGGPNYSPFTCPAVPPPGTPHLNLCGSGEAVGLGTFAEAIVDYPGVPPVLDEWIFSDGSVLALREIHTAFNCPGNNDCRSFNDQSFGNPFSLSVLATVDGELSTGRFAGATGTLMGQISIAGGIAIDTFTGTITVAS